MKRIIILALFGLRMLPASADSVYTFDMRNGLAPWASWMPVERTPDGVQMTLPGKLDANHLDGIGPLWLLAHLRVTFMGGPGITDFDQAEITIRLRGHDVDFKGSRLLWWLTGQLPREDTDPIFPWQETNWALTCCDLAPKISENWETITVKIDDSPARWTYAGTNLMQLGDWGRRYVEYPLSKILRDSAGSLHLAIVGTTASQAPSGKIEISEISIRTREPARPLPFNDVMQLVLQGRWEEARWHFEQLLPSEDPALNYQYGRLLAGGIGGSQDYQKAATCLQKAISLPEARLELAKLYFYGLGVPRDPSKAVQLLETELATKDPEGSYVLGLAYRFGIGTQQDSEKAKSFFLHAAQHGHAQAMLDLADQLTNSTPGEAYYWYRLARQRLTRDNAGAEADMIDHNIESLHRSLSHVAIWFEDWRASHFQPIR